MLSEQQTAHDSINIKFQCQGKFLKPFFAAIYPIPKPSYKHYSLYLYMIIYTHTHWLLVYSLILCKQFINKLDSAVSSINFFMGFFSFQNLIEHTHRQRHRTKYVTGISGFDGRFFLATVGKYTHYTIQILISDLNFKNTIGLPFCTCTERTPNTSQDFYDKIKVNCLTILKWFSLFIWLLW